MEAIVNINWKIAPKDWKGFKRWHALACPSDPLSAEERFKKEGGVLPKEPTDDNKRTQKKK